MFGDRIIKHFGVVPIGIALTSVSIVYAFYIFRSTEKKLDRVESGQHLRDEEKTNLADIKSIGVQLKENGLK